MVKNMIESTYLQKSTKLMKIWKSLGLEACKPCRGSDEEYSDTSKSTDPCRKLFNI